MPCMAVYGIYILVTNARLSEWRVKVRDRGKSPGERERSVEKRL